jgi:hypothetical protein
MDGVHIAGAASENLLQLLAAGCGPEEPHDNVSDPFAIGR